MSALVTSDEATLDCMMTYDFVAAQEELTSTCYEPMISIKPSASSYSTSSWTLGFNEAETFATEAEQTTYKGFVTVALAKLGVVATVTTATGAMNID